MIEGRSEVDMSPRLPVNSEIICVLTEKIQKKKEMIQDNVVCDVSRCFMLKMLFLSFTLWIILSSSLVGVLPGKCPHACFQSFAGTKR